MSDKMREAFERWFAETYYVDDGKKALYRNSSVERIAFNAWQAAISTVPTQEVRGEAVAHEFVYENGGYLHWTILQGSEAAGRASLEKSGLRIESVKPLYYATPTIAAAEQAMMARAVEELRNLARVNAALTPREALAKARDRILSLSDTKALEEFGMRIAEKVFAEISGISEACPGILRFIVSNMIKEGGK